MSNGHDKDFARRMEDKSGILEEIRDLLACVLAVLERPSCEAPSTRLPDQQTVAIALLAECGPNMTEIANRVGVHRTTLYRSPRFSEFRSAFEQWAELSRCEVRRGVADGGDVDGIESASGCDWRV